MFASVSDASLSTFMDDFDTELCGECAPAVSAACGGALIPALPYTTVGGSSSSASGAEPPVAPVAEATSGSDAGPSPKPKKKKKSKKVDASVEEHAAKSKLTAQQEAAE